jgi:hypothetical protein
MNVGPAARSAIQMELRRSGERQEQTAHAAQPRGAACVLILYIFGLVRHTTPHSTNNL